MRTLWLTLAVLLFLAAPAFAWSERYKWDPDPNAVSYRLEKSADAGATWTLALPDQATPDFTYAGSDTGTILFRTSNCGAVSCVPRPWGGYWHNEAWRPPSAPVNMDNP